MTEKYKGVIASVEKHGRLITQNLNPNSYLSLQVRVDSGQRDFYYGTLRFQI